MDYLHMSVPLPKRIRDFKRFLYRTFLKAFQKAPNYELHLSFQWELDEVTGSGPLPMTFDDLPRPTVKWLNPFESEEEMDSVQWNNETLVSCVETSILQSEERSGDLVERPFCASFAYHGSGH